MEEYKNEIAKTVDELNKAFKPFYDLQKILNNSTVQLVALPKNIQNVIKITNYLEKNIKRIENIVPSPQIYILGGGDDTDSDDEKSGMGGIMKAIILLNAATKLVNIGTFAINKWHQIDQYSLDRETIRHAKDKNSHYDEKDAKDHTKALIKDPRTAEQINNSILQHNNESSSKDKIKPIDMSLGENKMARAVKGTVRKINKFNTKNPNDRVNDGITDDDKTPLKKFLKNQFLGKRLEAIKDKNHHGKSINNIVSENFNQSEEGITYCPTFEIEIENLCGASDFEIKSIIEQRVVPLINLQMQQQFRNLFK